MKIARERIGALLCALLMLAPGAAAARQGVGELSFDVTDARPLFTREMGGGLLLRVSKESSVTQRDFGWRVEVVRGPYREGSPNLLYHSRRTLGAHPSQVYAWHVTTGQFPNVRELAVAGRPLAVRVELVNPVAEGRGPDSRFLSGGVRISWGPKGRLAPARARPEPRFEQYPADVYAGRPAPLDLRSHRLARLYRTLMREQQAEEGINFAGHYTLAAVGCGTGCSVTGFIDARDGRAYFPVALDGWTNIVGDYEEPEDEQQRSYRADSRLLRLVGRPNIGRTADGERYGPSGIYFYEWTGARLRLVHFRPVGSYPEADPPPRR